MQIIAVAKLLRLKLRKPVQGGPKNLAHFCTPYSLINY